MSEDKGTRTERNRTERGYGRKDGNRIREEGRIMRTGIRGIMGAKEEDMERGRKRESEIG